MIKALQSTLLFQGNLRYLARIAICCKTRVFVLFFVLNIDITLFPSLVKKENSDEERPYMIFVTGMGMANIMGRGKERKLGRLKCLNSTNLEQMICKTSEISKL